MTLAESAPMGIAVPAAGFYTITLRGTLDRVVGARLLRLVDARLQMAAYGHTSTRHVLLEISALDGVDAGGEAALRHAAHACERRGLTFDLVGAAAVGPHLGIGARQALSRYRGFPDVAAAVAELSA
jgi:ABC-type transporter Mla MlaB component